MKRLLLILFAGVLVLAVGSCAHYQTAHWGGVDPAEAPRIAVVMDENSLHTRLSTIMASSLMYRGFEVRSVFPTEVLPEDLLERVEPSKQYSFGEELTDQMSSGGNIRGDADLVERLLLLNDIQDASERYEDLLALRDRILEEWDVDYIMFIYPRGSLISSGLRNRRSQFGFNYAVRVIDVADREIVFTYFVNANKRGWEQVVSKRSVTSSLDEENVKISRRGWPLLFINRRIEAVDIEFCERVAALLIEEVD
jgi:hypothetical protein